MAILISKSLSYAKWADVDGAKRQAAAEAAVGVSSSEPPFSEDVCKARLRLSYFLSFYHSLRYPRILVFPASDPFVHDIVIFPHTYTQRISLACPCEATNASIPDTPERRRDTGRAARLYASATLNHSLEITYVWIDSYYYKAYVGRACAVGGPTIDSPDWPARLTSTSFSRFLRFLLALSPRRRLSLCSLTEEVHLSRLTVTNS